MNAMKKPATGEKLLTDVELELMQILWARGEGTVADVLESLPQNRDLAYTSVSTVLRILEQKKFLRARKEGRGHSYSPTLSREEYEARAVRDVVKKVFSGAPSALVRQLLGAVEIDAAELEEIRKILDRSDDGGRRKPGGGR